MTVQTATIDNLLEALGRPVGTIDLARFDVVGHVAAIRLRDPKSSAARRCGVVYRANYERGILADVLVDTLDPVAIFEVGFGHGYWSTCVLMRLAEMCSRARVVSFDVDFGPASSRASQLASVVSMLGFDPKNVFDRLTTKLVEGRVQRSDVERFVPSTGGVVLVHIDGDHTFEGVSSDWNAVEFLLERDDITPVFVFDDYVVGQAPPTFGVAKFVSGHVATREDVDVTLVDMDRRIFPDDRTIDPDFVRGVYGQAVVVPSENTDRGVTMLSRVLTEVRG